MDTPDDDLIESDSVVFHLVVDRQNCSVERDHHFWVPNEREKKANQLRVGFRRYAATDEPSVMHTDVPLSILYAALSPSRPASRGEFSIG